MERLTSQIVKPRVRVLHTAPLILAELASRTAYSSFDKSENETVVNFPELILTHDKLQDLSNDQVFFQEYCEVHEDVDSSKIVNDLSWVYHHESVLEQVNISFSVQGLGRGVLQEWSRHRIGMSQTVQSSRYTMQDLLYIYNVADSFDEFIELMSANNIFIFGVGTELWDNEVTNLWQSLRTLESLYGGDFLGFSMSKDALSMYYSDEFNTTYDQLKALQNCKAKRNVGDLFKTVVTDNWSCDLVITMNLRAIKNFLKLRDSGAAWWMMQDFAIALKEELPIKYRELVTKK